MARTGPKAKAEGIGYTPVEKLISSNAMDMNFVTAVRKVSNTLEGAKEPFIIRFDIGVVL